MPDLIDVPSGCSFHPRCPYAEDVCVRREPELVDPETGTPVGPDDDRGARCLAYTGELSGDLAYTVRVTDEEGGAAGPERGETDD